MLSVKKTEIIDNLYNTFDIVCRAEHLLSENNVSLFERSPSSQFFPQASKYYNWQTFRRFSYCDK